MSGDIRERLIVGHSLIEPVADLKGKLDEWIGHPSEIYTKGKTQVWLRWHTLSGLPMLEVGIHEGPDGRWCVGAITCPFQNSGMWDQILKFGREEVSDDPDF